MHIIVYKLQIVLKDTIYCAKNADYIGYYTDEHVQTIDYTFQYIQIIMYKKNHRFTIQNIQ